LKKLASIFVVSSGMQAKIMIMSHVTVKLNQTFMLRMVGKR